VPVLGSLGMVYLEISEQFKDIIKEYHNQALKLLESPIGKMGGGAAWADLAFCAIELRDLRIAEEAVQQGLNHPNFFMRLERPRHLAASARLAQIRGEMDEAVRLAGEACDYAEEHSMLYLYPLLFLVQGEILSARDDREDIPSGDGKAGIKSQERAEKHARELGMLPIIWKALAAQADTLASTGQADQAGQKLEQARAAVEEIIKMFEDPDLRQAYRQNVLPQLERTYS
jgi:ATP/maltotriose-dependent transcriptional regulator MalT